MKPRVNVLESKGQTFEDNSIEALPRFKTRTKVFCTQQKFCVISIQEVLAAYVSVFSQPANKTVIPEDEKREHKLARSIGTIFTNAFNVNLKEGDGKQSSYKIEKFGFTDSHLYFVGTTKRDRKNDEGNRYRAPTDGSDKREIFIKSVANILCEVHPNAKLLSRLNKYIRNLPDLMIDEHGMFIPPSDKLNDFLAMANKDNQYDIDKLSYLFKLAVHFYKQFDFLQKNNVTYDQSVYDAKTQSNLFDNNTCVFRFENITIWSCPTNQLSQLLKGKLTVKPENQSLFNYALEEAQVIYTAANATPAHVNKPTDSYLGALIPVAHGQPMPSPLPAPQARLFARKDQAARQVEMVRHVRFVY